MSRGRVRGEGVCFGYAPVQTAAGDSITLVYGLIANGPLFETEMFFPELIGIKLPTLYAADDGSTYFDAALTQLGANACEFP